MNNLHHKFSYRLHKLLPALGVAGIQRIPAPGMTEKFLYVRAEDGGVAHQLIMYHEYEPFESKLVREQLKPGMTVYNIGANLGYYALLASECVGAEGKVYAFEPAPENFELLRRTISENGCANIELFPSAVSDRSGEATLSISATNSGDHQLRMDSSRDHIQVPTVSIDEFIKKGHASPNAIIMDVQGAELDVLRGAKSLLASNAPLVLFTEFWPGGLDERHPNGAKEMLELLEHEGFQMHQIAERRKRLHPVACEALLEKIHGNMEVNLLCLR
jgi:FkbM family methyltransferase